MINTLPSQNLTMLGNLLGRKILSVKRQLFKDDRDLGGFEENADGPVEFIVDDNSVFHLIAETEVFSVGVVSGQMPLYGSSYKQVDVSNDSFWKVRIGQTINQLTIYKASDWSEDYPSEFGVEIMFENGKKALIEYVGNEENLDMVRVVEGYEGLPCITKSMEL